MLPTSSLVVRAAVDLEKDAVQVSAGAPASARKPTTTDHHTGRDSWNSKSPTVMVEQVLE